MWAAVYGLSDVALRFLPPSGLVFCRVALGAAVLVPVAWRRHGFGELRRRPVLLVLTVLVQVTIPLFLLARGQLYVTSSVAGILVGAQPLILALLAMVWARDQRPVGVQQHG